MIRKVASAVQSGIRTTEKTLRFMGACMLLAMMFLGAGDVIGRYLFNSPIHGTMEWSQMLMAGLVLLSLGYVQATESHISVVFIVLLYPQRVRLMVHIATLILSLFILGVIAWQSTIIALTEMEQKRLIETILLPAFPFKLLVSVGASIACLECILQISHLFCRLKEKGTVS